MFALMRSGHHVDRELCSRAGVERKAAQVWLCVCGGGGGCPEPLPCCGAVVGRHGLVSDTFGGRVDRTQ